MKTQNKMELSLEPIKLNEDPNQPQYASENCQSLLKMWKEYYPKIGFNFPWVGYFIKENDKIVGCCAFTGAPVNNKVEISYWTFKEFIGQGIATFACRQLVAIAEKTLPGVTISAKTEPQENASTKILKQSGFVFSEVVQDHEIGDAWEWIFKKEI
jgi:RimJ/RimL family protein N-acetyltransferase